MVEIDLFEETMPSSATAMISQTNEPSPVALSTLGVGATATVSSVRPCSRELRNKLFSMGLVPGQKIQVLSFAPLGDPMTIRVLGFNLALRLTEAAQVMVEADS